jgi:class 3 adenylate cyclase
MQPGMAGAFGAERQERIVSVFGIATAKTLSGWRVRRIVVQPLGNATGEGLGLGLRTRQSSIELDHTGAFVKEDMPVLSRPAVFGRPQQRQDLGLEAGQEIDHGAWRRHRRRQNQVFAVDSELDSGYVGRPESLNRAHIRPLQPVTVFSTDGAEGGLRISASPSAVVTLTRMNGEIDVRHVMPTIRVPTLILHCAGDRAIDIGGAKYMAQQIPQARLIELPGSDHFPWLTNADAVLGEIEEFLTGTRHVPEPDRVLATVLFTDIVDSTKRAAEIGDQSWHRVLDEHDRTARWIVEKYRGRLVRTTGDGILATFDGPGRAIRCALDFETAATQIGLSLRAGLHTGEVERRDRDVGGIAVHAAARVMALSGPDEVLVSRVVTDLVAGAGLKFAERGSHELKGLPGRWDLFAAST